MPKALIQFTLLHLTFHQCQKTETAAGDGIDNDCDGRIDEEKLNGKDDDADGTIDEDLEMVKDILLKLQWLFTYTAFKNVILKREKFRL